MKLKAMCLLLGALVLAGCFQKSLHAFYTPGDVVAEPKIIGAWQQLDEQGNKEKGQIWTFTESGQKNYRLGYTNENETLNYEARVFTLDDQRFMDIVSIGESVSTIPSHHLFKVVEVGSHLQVAMLNLDWMRKWLRQNPASLSHIVVVNPQHREDRDQDEFILTADTKALQAFVRQHRNDADFFTGTVKLERMQREASAKK